MSDLYKHVTIKEYNELILKDSSIFSELVLKFTEDR